MNSQDSSCEWRKKIVKPNSPCVLSLEDKTNAAEHKVLRPNPKKDLAVRQTSVPKSKTARPKYRQLDCGTNETVLAVPLHSEISPLFSFPVCPAASAWWRGMSGSLWKPERERNGSRILGAHPPTRWQARAPQDLVGVTLLFQMFQMELVVVVPYSYPPAGLLERFGQEQLVLTFWEVIIVHPWVSWSSGLEIRQGCFVP